MDKRYKRYHALQAEAIRACPPYPAARFSGRGIVICAGGPKYFTGAWVSINLLRRVLDCALPIELWYLGQPEMNSEMIGLLEPLGVDCVDALAVRHRHPVRTLGGWELKPYAIIHSSFKEVLLLDADNIPVVDPAFLLSEPEYERTGALFWPDIHRYSNEAIWRICQIVDQGEPEFESGQVVVDKQRCWQALHITLHLNEYSDFYYRYILGDKETFHLAWRMLNQSYGMTPHSSKSVHGEGLVQHDFDGRVIFEHRSTIKWNAYADRPPSVHFQFEDECQEFLRELRSRWNGRASTFRPVLASAPTIAAELLRTRYYAACRLGADEKILEFLPGGWLGLGGDRCERTWRLRHGRGAPRLEISGWPAGEELPGLAAEVERGLDGVWRGRSLHGERLPLELIPRARFSEGPDRPLPVEVAGPRYPLHLGW